MKTVEGHATDAAGEFLNYGVLGIVCLLLLAAVVIFWRMDRSRSIEDRLRITKLEGEQTKYLAEDRILLTKALESCTNALDSNSEALNANSKVMARLETVLEKK